MQVTITPSQIRQNNRLLIYHLIYNKKRISRQEICYELGLSRPTVTGILSSLEEKGLVRKEGFMESGQAGRKAAAYQIDETFRIALGVEILKNEFRMLAVNLYGELMDCVIISLEYHNADYYYKEVADAIRDFLVSLHITRQQVLGIGFAMEALFSADGQSVVYGKLLENTGMNISAFTRHLNYPCTLMRPSSCAAVAELWASPDLDNAMFLSLSRHLGAAAITGRSIPAGKHGHNTAIEHLQIRPGGKRCYCGKEGCMETLCSVSALLVPGETLDEFFRRVREKDPSCSARWNTYLSDLAYCINFLHLMSDTDFILGGKLAAYFSQDDIETLYRYLAALSPYTEAPDYLHITRLLLHDTVTGAALPYIWSFLGNADL